MTDDARAAQAAVEALYAAVAAEATWYQALPDEPFLARIAHEQAERLLARLGEPPSAALIADVMVAGVAATYRAINGVVDSYEGLLKQRPAS